MSFCDEIQKLGKGIGSTGRYQILESLLKGPLTVGEVVKSVEAEHGQSTQEESSHVPHRKRPATLRDSGAGKEQSDRRYQCNCGQLLCVEEESVQ